MCIPNWPILIYSQRRRKEILNCTKGKWKKFRMTTRSGKSDYLQAVTMIDPATGWIEIRRILSVLGRSSSQPSIISLVDMLLTT